MVNFSKPRVLERVLDCNWCFFSFPILFKKQTPLFDAKGEKLEELLVWVCFHNLGWKISLRWLETSWVSFLK